MSTWISSLKEFLDTKETSKYLQAIRLYRDSHGVNLAYARHVVDQAVKTPEILFEPNLLVKRLVQEIKEAPSEQGEALLTRFFNNLAEKERIHYEERILELEGALK
jgi:hypothetical protein